MVAASSPTRETLEAFAGQSMQRLSIHDLGHRFVDYLIRGLARWAITRARMAASGTEEVHAALERTVAMLGAGSALGQAVALDLGRGGARLVAVDQ